MTATGLRLLAGVLLVAVMAIGGCSQDKIKTEHAALYRQNQELQNELSRAREALEASELDRNQLASENSDLRSQLDDARNQPVPPPPPAPVARTNTGFDAVEGVETIRGSGSITVRIPGDVLFDSGKVALKASSKATLDQIAAVLAKEYRSNTIRIEGYTDADPIKKSSWADNLELSLERAASVHRYPNSKGIDNKRMYAAGFGETKPRDTKARSRRVEIVVLLSS